MFKKLINIFSDTLFNYLNWYVTLRNWSKLIKNLASKLKLTENCTFGLV